MNYDLRFTVFGGESLNVLNSTKKTYLRVSFKAKGKHCMLFSPFTAKMCEDN